ncbi:bifunctional methylenetetrahydrofolate dehydrogenase/methenyltetrahydrofolate cyclohydrolase FolD [Amedibacillus dolichus]|uniref:bifunctional methylenetetrahydrofolate dehydrogenase/methenyltetrahydrofolate cyclohydrolase FolD n=1 Tax=Amedibacillus dolichus TaxID=31971 RepID=UPI0039A324D7
MAEIVYGSEIAKKIKAKLAAKMQTLKQEGKRLPKLCVVLVGNHPASLSYVTGKEKACREIGMENDLIRLPQDISEKTLLDFIRKLNADAAVDGILVQLPLPAHINEHKVLFAIDPAKDVDGFHPISLGKLMLQEDTFISCTPKGIMRILEEIGYDDLSGKKAVVVGRSNIVGKPVAQLLMNKHATVTVCHSRTKNVEEIAAQADILIAAIGKPRYIHASWVKEGAVVIDVGINRDENNKLCGDVDFEAVKEKAAYITPVPKGVGPMTIAMLLENTLEAYEKKEG